MNSVSRRNYDDSDGANQADAAVPYIPLTDEAQALSANGQGDKQSIGSLVKDASQHLSTLVRAEVELAKSEVVGEVKKGVKGSVFFIIALTVFLYSTFFFFFFLDDLLDIWLPRWLSSLIVFVFMLVIVGACAFLGYLKVRKIKAPERSIKNAKETADVLKRNPFAAADEPEHPQLTDPSTRRESIEG